MPDALPGAVPRFGGAASKKRANSVLMIRVAALSMAATRAGVVPSVCGGHAVHGGSWGGPVGEAPMGPHSRAAGAASWDGVEGRESEAWRREQLREESTGSYGEAMRRTVFVGRRALPLGVAMGMAKPAGAGREVL